MIANRILLFFISLIIAFVAGVIIFYTAFALAIMLVPARTADGLHPVMPTGQMFISTLIAFIAGIYLLVVIYRKLKQ